MKKAVPTYRSTVHKTTPASRADFDVSDSSVDEGLLRVTQILAALQHRRHELRRATERKLRLRAVSGR
jgi:hypothetical protein